MGDNTRKKEKELTIILPAYNEENTIRSVIREVKLVMKFLGISNEILVINDGSTDSTLIEAKKENVRIIDLKNNMGKGNALRIGFSLSSGDNILTIDTDGSHCYDDIQKIIEGYLESNYHMLIGSRFLERPNKRITSPTNVVGNKIFKYILYFLSGSYITDSQSGLRIFRKSILSSINSNSKGYEIEAELTAETIGSGFRVGELAISCKPRMYGTSHLRSVQDGIKIVLTIFRSYFQSKMKAIMDSKSKG